MFLICENVSKNNSHAFLWDIQALYRDLEGAYGHGSAEGSEDQEKLWEQVIVDPRQHILVGEKDRRIIGTLTVIENVPIITGF